MVAAEFAADVETVDDDAYVRISSFDGGRSRFGPVVWQPRGDGVLPRRGDPAWVEEADDGQWVAIAWRTAATSTASVVGSPINVRASRFGGPDPLTGDWSAAFNLARAEGEDTQTEIHVPPHEDPYLIAEAVPHDRPLSGGGPGTIIKAHPALADTDAPMLLDGAPMASKLTVRDLVLDGDLIPGVQLIGSTVSGGRHGTYLSRYENLTIRSTAPDVYALGVPGNTDPAGDPAPGLFVGSVFEQLYSDNCAAILNASVNQDDILFDAPRFHLYGTNQATVGPPLRFYTCSDVRLINPYIKTAEIDYDVAGVRAFIWVGGLPFAIEGGLWETYDADPTNLTHLIYCIGTDTRFTWKDAVVGMRATNTPDLVALVRTGAPDFDSFDIWPRADVHNITRFGFAGYDPVDVPVFDHYQTPDAVEQRPFTMGFSGIDDWPTIMQFAAGSDTEPGDAVALHGDYRGRRYDHHTDNASVFVTDGLRTTTTEDARTQYLWHGGLPPVTETGSADVEYQLPAPGLYQIGVTALLNGDPEHLITGAWQVAWRNGTFNDILETEQIGATKMVTGSTFLPTGLTVSDPDTAGVVTIEATWSEPTADIPVRFAVSARRIAPFYPET